MKTPRYPLLYQINTRICLAEIAGNRGRPATFDDLSDSYLAEIARLGFDWVWLLGIWQTGPLGRKIALAIPELRDEYRRALPDFSDADVCGSPFAVQAYTVHSDFGGEDALQRLRQRMRTYGLRLMLDFVPNHTALDHAWAFEHPEFYVQGDEATLSAQPHNFCRTQTAAGPRVLAHGRDPYFAGWTDTLQLNYRAAAFRRAMTTELTRISGLCDGLRCDMAMLILPEIFQRTWEQLSIPKDGTTPVDVCFWPDAIRAVREQHSQFLFVAEVYWDLEWTLQQQGFDATYDKRLHDILHAGDAPAIRGHLHAASEYQRKSVRFLENHDEPRAASLFSPQVHEAAAVVAFLIPGLRFFHEGQLEGRRIKVPVQLCRRCEEPVDAPFQAFYGRLLACLTRPEVRDGDWRLLECRQAWEGNPTVNQFIAGFWTGAGEQRLLVAVNFGGTQGQSYVPLAEAGLQSSRDYVLADVLGNARYGRSGADLANRGLYLDLPAWGYHVFDVRDADRE